MGQDESQMVGDDVEPQTLDERSLKAVARYIQSGDCKKIVVLTGAGISTAAGIPDFRSPGTGLYDNLEKLKLDTPESVFELNYFRKNPKPFYVLAQEIYPGKHYPTIGHVFIELLASKNFLRMLFTQNIDCLERAAEIPDELIIEAHGSFATQSCIDCKQEFPKDEMLRHVESSTVPYCPQMRWKPKKSEKKSDKKSAEESEELELVECKGLVKPDIVFFGEALPPRFTQNMDIVNEADLMLIFGTSLSVHPFAGLPQLARPGVPRVLFNLQQVGGIGTRADDVVVLGDCDSSVRELAEMLGWTSDLEKKWMKLCGSEKEADQQIARMLAHREARKSVFEDDSDDDDSNGEAETAAGSKEGKDGFEDTIFGPGECIRVATEQPKRTADVRNAAQLNGRSQSGTRHSSAGGKLRGVRDELDGGTDGKHHGSNRHNRSEAHVNGSDNANSKARGGSGAFSGIRSRGATEAHESQGSGLDQAGDQTNSAGLDVDKGNKGKQTFTGIRTKYGGYKLLKRKVDVATGPSLTAHWSTTQARDKGRFVSKRKAQGQESSEIARSVSQAAQPGASSKPAASTSSFANFSAEDQPLTASGEANPRYFQREATYVAPTRVQSSPDQGEMVSPQVFLDQRRRSSAPSPDEQRGRSVPKDRSRDLQAIAEDPEEDRMQEDEDQEMDYGDIDSDLDEEALEREDQEQLQQAFQAGMDDEMQAQAAERTQNSTQDPRASSQLSLRGKSHDQDADRREN